MNSEFIENFKKLHVSVLFSYRRKNASKILLLSTFYKPPFTAMS